MEDIEELVGKCLVGEFSGEEVVEPDPEIGQTYQKVLVDAELEGEGVFSIKLVSIIKEEHFQVFESRDGIVGGTSRLLSLHSLQSYPNICCGYHVHVIGSISNGESN